MIMKVPVPEFERFKFPSAALPGGCISYVFEKLDRVRDSGVDI